MFCREQRFMHGDIQRLGVGMGLLAEMAERYTPHTRTLGRTGLRAVADDERNVCLKRDVGRIRRRRPQERG